jgi:hypothetical protein
MRPVALKTRPAAQALPLFTRPWLGLVPSLFSFHGKTSRLPLKRKEFYEDWMISLAT